MPLFACIGANLYVYADVDNQYNNSFDQSFTNDKKHSITQTNQTVLPKHDCLIQRQQHGVPHPFAANASYYNPSTALVCTTSGSRRYQKYPRATRIEMQAAAHRDHCVLNLFFSIGRSRRNVETMELDL